MVLSAKFFHDQKVHVRILSRSAIGIGPEYHDALGTESGRDGIDEFKDVGYLDHHPEYITPSNENRCPHRCGQRS